MGARNRVRDALRALSTTQSQFSHNTGARSGPLAGPRPGAVGPPRHFGVVSSSSSSRSASRATARAWLALSSTLIWLIMILNSIEQYAMKPLNWRNTTTSYVSEKSLAGLRFYQHRPKDLAGAASPLPLVSYYTTSSNAFLNLIEPAQIAAAQRWMDYD